jgi:hypothetical protein
LSVWRCDRGERLRDGVDPATLRDAPVGSSSCVGLWIDMLDYASDRVADRDGEAAGLYVELLVDSIGVVRNPQYAQPRLGAQRDRTSACLNAPRGCSGRIFITLMAGIRGTYELFR